MNMDLFIVQPKISIDFLNKTKAFKFCFEKKKIEQQIERDQML